MNGKVTLTILALFVLSVSSTQVNSSGSPGERETSAAVNSIGSPGERETSAAVNSSGSPGERLQRTDTSVTVEPRCQCIKTTSHFIHPNKMKDIDIFRSSPHCSNVEVIVTLKSNRKVCLDPKAPWVMKLIEKILENN